jgi:hypothetical protein
VRKLLVGLLFLFSSVSICLAEEKYEISTALGFGESGINKVLCMKNGTTFLLHFENNKPIKTIVFDSSHKRVAGSTLSCRVFDIFMLSTAVFKGLYEINGEVVLFLEQQNTARHALIRLQLNAATGKLTDETTVGRALSISKPTRFFVMRHKTDPGYQILFCQDAQQFGESKIHLAYYNARHEVYKDIPLVFNRKKYDYMHVVGAEAQPEGVCVSLGLSNMLVNGTGTTVAAMPLYNHYLHVFYIPRDSTRPLQKTADLASDVIPYYTNFTYNPFAATVNLLMLSYKDALFRYGIDMRPTAFVSNLLFRFEETNLGANYNWLTNKLANKKLLETKDTSNLFTGFPVMMTTNSNGLTTVVSESYDRYINAENFSRSQVFETFIGNFCITQFDDEGKELWGTVLPKSQYYRSYRHYYRPADFAKRWQNQAMFNDLPPQIYERQFVASNIYERGGDFYLVFNDCGKNFNNSLQTPGDTVFTSALSNACYYKINRKKEVSKHFLLGAPLNKEYKSCCIEGAGFDEERGVYAAVIRYKRGSYISQRMAWARLD